MGNIASFKDGPIGHLVFDNPERLNAMEPHMWGQLSNLADRFVDDQDVRVIVLSGAGDRAFVSGGDISRLPGAGDSASGFAIVENAMEHLRSIRKPTVAKIRGWCLGGGMSIALSCDLRICSAEARFGIPAARLGVGYGLKDIKQLMDVVGSANAREILYTARQYSASDALRLGLVHHVFEATELDGSLQAYVNALADNAPLTVAASKAALNELAKSPADQDLSLCERLIAECRTSSDFEEGKAAFLEKRKPRFLGS